MTPERVAHGRKLASLLCASCHADDKTGKLTGKHLEEMPPEFGDVWSKNITQHREAGIGAWTDGQIAYLLRTGLRPDGQYVPPWMIKLPHASDEDIASIIAYLRSDDPAVAAEVGPPLGRTQPTFFSKALTHTVMKPLPYPTSPVVAPPKTDRVAYGRYLVYSLDCYSCHSADSRRSTSCRRTRASATWAGQHAERCGPTPDPHGEPHAGRRDGHRPLERGRLRARAPQGLPPGRPRAALPDAAPAGARRGRGGRDLRVPPDRAEAPQRVERRFAEPVASGHPGKRLYAKYGCGGCHGEHGVGMGGLADLRRANERYRSDADLRAWIEDAPSKKRGTKMPAWRGIIRDDDYGPLLAYVRALSTANDGRAASNP